MYYTLGLDMGIASTGWAVINWDRPRIENLGVRMFPVAEEPKTGESLAAERRQFRSARRQIRRRRFRLKRVREWIVRSGLLPFAACARLGHRFPGDRDVWQVRAAALDERLSDRDFARVLVHWAGHRGYRSNRKSESAADKDKGKVLQAVHENRERMVRGGYRTVAEMMVAERSALGGTFRNHGGVYSHMVTRGELEEEIHAVFAAQRALGQAFATPEHEAAYLKIWSAQRPFACGSDVLDKVGYCPFERGEKRAPRASYTFQKFRALETLSHLRLVSPSGSRKLTDGERRQAWSWLSVHQACSYWRLRHLLALDDTVRFSGVVYEASVGLKENEKEKLLSVQDLYAMRKAVKDAGVDPDGLYPSDYDAFAFALTVYKEDDAIRRYLQDASRNLSRQSYSGAVIESLLALSFSSFGHLSFKALHRLIPSLEAGKSYTEAVRGAGYRLVTAAPSRFLPPIPKASMANPVVYRSLTQTRKVINAVIRTYGPPSSVNIELAREMGRPHTERRRDQKRMKQNGERNEEVRAAIRSAHPEISAPRGHDILKLRLWKEQGGLSLYSGRPIPEDRLFDPKAVEVDHIIPYSRSFDDSRMNKGVVWAKENQEKRNRTPYEWLGSNGARWEDFEKRVQAAALPRRKKNLLLKKSLDRAQEETFKQRHLVDTRYMARFMRAFLESHLQFQDESGRQRAQHVFSLNGAFTSLLRKRWGFNKNRQASDLHHALDAAIIATASPAFIKKINTYFTHHERGYSRAMAASDRFFPEPWDGFSRELAARMMQDPERLTRALGDLARPAIDPVFLQTVRPIFVSRAPQHRLRGALHAATRLRVRGKTEKGLYQVIKRCALQNLPFDANGDFPMYDRVHNEATYQAVRRRYLSVSGSGDRAKKAFSKPLYKPSRSGHAPVIRSVKIIDAPLSYPVFFDEIKAAAHQAHIARVDVYQNSQTGRYRLSPAYPAELKNGCYQPRLIKAGTPHEACPEPSGSDVFQFSLFSNDVIYLRLKRPKRASKMRQPGAEKAVYQSGFFYFKGVDRASGAVTLIDPAFRFSDRLGVSTALDFKKYQVDPLGRLHRAK